MNILTPPITKAGKGLPQNAGLGVLPSGWKDFCGLMFGYFASKVNGVAFLSAIKKTNNPRKTNSLRGPDYRWEAADVIN